MGTANRGWNFNINFIGHMNTILWVTLILSVLSVASVAVYGLNFGTDFAGGYELQVHFPQAVSESDIRQILEPMQLQDVRVQRFGAEGENSYLILVRDGAEGDLKPQEASITQALTGEHAADDLLGVMVAENGEGITLHYGHAPAEAAVRASLQKLGLTVKKVVTEAHSTETVIQVSLTGLADKVAQHLVSGLRLPQDYDPLVRVEFVGPQVGAQLRNQGVMAVVYSLLLILVYVAIRFDMFFAPGAIIATLHDIVLTIGFLSFFQIDFNLTVVAAILTLIGFSLNDTIVVYDRVRENAVKLRGMALRPLVNQSINETLSRTILTSGTVFLVTGSLLLLGGPFIRAFAWTMFVGVVVGTYSSIAVASPLYIALREYGERPRRSGKASGAVV
jgi:preprotein translocase subunit SecF